MKKITQWTRRVISKKNQLKSRIWKITTGGKFISSPRVRPKVSQKSVRNKFSKNLDLLRFFFLSHIDYPNLMSKNERD